VVQHQRFSNNHKFPPECATSKMWQTSRMTKAKREQMYHYFQPDMTGRSVGSVTRVVKRVEEHILCFVHQAPIACSEWCAGKRCGRHSESQARSLAAWPSTVDITHRSAGVAAARVFGGTRTFSGLSVRVVFTGMLCRLLGREDCVLPKLGHGH